MWEIYAYQNADSLFGIFNAAATIHGSGDYRAAVAAVASPAARLWTKSWRALVAWRILVAMRWTWRSTPWAISAR